jgi:hypothetical protein
MNFAINSSFKIRNYGRITRQGTEVIGTQGLLQAERSYKVCRLSPLPVSRLSPLGLLKKIQNVKLASKAQILSEGKA